MAEPFEELAGLDRMIHEPARLAILTALSACRSADFTFLHESQCIPFQQESGRIPHSTH